MTEEDARRKRDPERTRQAILEAAREVLAQDGKEGLSLTQVAHRAGVNRGTAHEHFQTREQLIEATAAWISDKLFRAVFGDPALVRHRTVTGRDIEAVNRHLATFAMENPTLSRIWLFEVLSSSQPANDPFWRQYQSALARFAKTEAAQPGMDVEVLSVLFLAGFFMWPLWARAHACTPKERRRMALRFTREVIRLTLHGTLRSEKYPEIDAGVKRARRTRDGSR